ncbi:MAG: hypothetical protein NW208_09110 [Bryobacter sp.]|nr:hypothetical protein [Bryobacter sp.]
MLNPSQYSSAPVAQLLHEVALGRIGFDQRVYDAILSRPAEAGPALLAHGLNPPADSRLELDEDVLHLLTALPEVDPLEYILKLLREGYTEFPESLPVLLRRAGARAVEPLLEIYRSLEEEESSEIAFLLAGLELHDPRIAQMITERLEFDMEDGAILAGLYGDPALVPVLSKYLSEVGQNRELEFAIETLKHRPAAPETLPFQPREEYPEFALPVFDVMTDEEILAAATGHEEIEVRLEALDILEDVDLPANFAAPLLAMAADSPELPLRAGAWRALHRLSQVTEVREAAIAALADEDLPAQVRVGALITLLPDVPLPRLKAYITEFLADPDAKADAVSAMWRSREPFYASAFGAYLDDEDVEVVRQAVRGAGVMGDKTALAKLRALLRDSELRDDALFAYAMATPSDISPSRMRSLLKKIDEEAGGLSQSETTNVQLALDMRLEAAGKEPIFFTEDEADGENPASSGHIH